MGVSQERILAFRIYAVRLLIPTELNRCLNVFVKIGFGTDFVSPVEPRTSVVS